MKKIILPLFAFVLSMAITPPELNEPNIFPDYAIPLKYKNDVAKKFDILSLNKVIKSAMENNKNNSYYQRKIDYLLSDIKNDKYNFDIYATLGITTGRLTSNKYGNSAYTDETIALHADKLLYDGDYFLTDKYDILNKRLALINEINAKKRFKTLVITSYINLYFAQENLKYLKKQLDNNKKLFLKIKERYKKHTISQIKFITAKRDLLNLKDVYAIAVKNYIHNDYVLRQFLNSHSQKPFLLQPFNINLKINDFKQIQKDVLKNSSEIARESNILKLRETDYLSQKRRFHPTITLTTSLGYSLTKNKEFDMAKQSEGPTWSIALTARQPIYNRDDIRLNIERAKYSVLKQKNKLQSTQKKVLINIENLYRTIQLLTYRISIQNEKTKLLKTELEIYKKRFLQGLVDYDTYSKSLNNYIKSLQKLETLKRNKSINKLLLSMIWK